MKHSNLQFSKFTRFISRSVFGELQLMQISLNFEIYCCSLKIIGLVAKRRVDFLQFLFWKELWRLKVKESIVFVGQKFKVLIKMRRNQKWKIPHTVLERWTMCFNSYRDCELKIELWCDKLELATKKTTKKT